MGDFVSLFGTADPELLEHEGKSFMDRGVRRVVDVHGHSLSLYTGTGGRRHTAHDIIVRKLESILKFAGQNDIVAEDADIEAMMADKDQSALVKVPAFMVSSALLQDIRDDELARKFAVEKGTHLHSNVRFGIVGRFIFEDFYGDYD